LLNLPSRPTCVPDDIPLVVYEQESPDKNELTETIRNMVSSQKEDTINNLNKSNIPDNIKSQLHKLKWEQIKLKRTLITLIEYKKSIEVAYLQLTNEEEILSTSKEQRSYSILNQENFIAQALKKREEEIETYRSNSIKSVNRVRKRINEI